MEDRLTATEEAARAAWQRQDFESVTRIVLTDYGLELYSFVLAQFRGQSSSAEEVFSEFTEDLWRALPKFEWRCSIRAWCYKLARSASSRYRRSPHNRADRRVPLSDVPLLSEAVQRLRTETQPHLRSEVKNKVQRLREKLVQEDQDLLILRIDRNLSWRDVVHAMHEPDDVPTNEQARRLEAALRQRFAEVKKRLRRLAEEEGLL
jgi:RNA polymerase sigma-70 factor (ECF subfamily)